MPLNPTRRESQISLIASNQVQESRGIGDLSQVKRRPFRFTLFTIKSLGQVKESREKSLLGSKVDPFKSTPHNGTEIVQGLTQTRVLVVWPPGRPNFRMRLGARNRLR